MGPGSRFPGEATGLGVLDLGCRASQVAPQLLGCQLKVGSNRVILTELEAYEGANDPASHACRGVTGRNRVMFEEAGRLYVYLCYGIHALANIVVDREGNAGAVLVRGIMTAVGEVVSGPGRVTRYLGINLSDNGCDLQDGRIALDLDAPKLLPRSIAVGPRVGIRNGSDLEWRFIGSW